MMRQWMALDGGAGPATPIGGAKASAIVSGALDAVFGPMPGGGDGGGGDAGAGGGGAGAGGVAAKVGAVVIALGLAGAVIVWLATNRGQTQTSPSASPSTSTSTSTSPSTETETETETESEAEGPVEVEVTVPVRPPEKKDVRTPDEKDVRTPDKKEPAVIEMEAESAEDLLKEANAARGKKKWREADALYARVMAEHEGTKAAQVAAVASGTLHLEHFDDASGAASRFKKAVALGPRGPVAEEARYGLAEAYRELGDDEREKKALESFLANHPDSPLVDGARKRLESLDR